MSESKTWLPRITEDEIHDIRDKFGDLHAGDIANHINNRLEEFEAKCSWVGRHASGDWIESTKPLSGFMYYSLMLPPRPIKRALEFMTCATVPTDEIWVLAGDGKKYKFKIEREGIIE